MNNPRSGSAPKPENDLHGRKILLGITVALRGGISGRSVTAGAGLIFSWFQVNAAFQDHKDLGFTHRVSLGVKW